MIKKGELIEKHKEFGIPLSTIEKDYVLSLIIWGISQNDNLRESWIFKGGTALKKCYFGNYRFSEDLDYTLTKEAHIDPKAISKELIKSFEMIRSKFGLSIRKENLVINPFPDKQGLVIQIKVPFQGPLLSSGALPRIKLDLSAEEILVDNSVKLPLLHNYSDAKELDTMVSCYSIYEIFAEKLRALVERTRPRDIYDIVHLKRLFNKTGLPKNQLHSIAIQKFQVKGLTYPDALQVFHQNSISEAKSDWEHMLKHQVSPLEEFDIYWNKVQSVIEWVTT